MKCELNVPGAPSVVTSLDAIPRIGESVHFDYEGESADYRIRDVVWFFEEHPCFEGARLVSVRVVLALPGVS